MEIQTVRKNILEVAKRWKEQYKNSKDPDKQRILKELESFWDLSKVTEDEIETIIGNRSWTRITCDECNRSVQGAVTFTNGDDHMVTICLNCLNRAVLDCERNGVVEEVPEDTSECCINCGNPEATCGPDPFMDEIHGDDTPVWLCERCRYESAMDI